MREFVTLASSWWSPRLLVCTTWLFHSGSGCSVWWRWTCCTLEDRQGAPLSETQNLLASFQTRLRNHNHFHKNRTNVSVSNLLNHLTVTLNVYNMQQRLLFSFIYKKAHCLKLFIPGLKLSFEIGLLMALQIRGESDIKSFSQTYSTAEFTNSQMALNHLVVQPYRGSCWGWRACFWRRGTASISDGGGKRRGGGKSWWVIWWCFLTVLSHVHTDTIATRSSF